MVAWGEDTRPEGGPCGRGSPVFRLLASRFCVDDRKKNGLKARSAQGRAVEKSILRLFRKMNSGRSWASGSHPLRAATSYAPGCAAAVSVT